MLITFDHDIDAQGNVIALHQIETTDPNVLITFTAINGNPAAQLKAGYNEIHKIIGHPAGETRYQRIIAQLATAPANDPVKQLNLK